MMWSFALKGITMATIDPNQCFCSDTTLFGHFAVEPLLSYHGRVVTTFDKLEEGCSILEVANRILLVVIAPFAYLVLGLAALFGVSLKAISACHRNMDHREPLPPIDNQPSATTGVGDAVQDEEENPTADFSAWRQEFVSEARQRASLAPATLENALIEQLQPKVIDVQFSQYTFPENNPEALGDSFRCAEAIIWMNIHFKEILEKLIGNDQQFFIDMQRIILKEGKEARLSIFGLIDSLREPPLSEEILPQNLHEYTDRYQALQIGEDDDQALTKDDTLLDCLNKLFSPCNPDVRRFALVTVGEKNTYGFLRIDNKHSLLFDPHSTQFQVVTKDSARAYLEKDVTAEEENQLVHFCHGKIDRVIEAVNS